VERQPRGEQRAQLVSEDEEVTRPDAAPEVEARKRDAREAGPRRARLRHLERDEAAVLQARDRERDLAGLDRALEDLPIAVRGPVLELRHCLTFRAPARPRRRPVGPSAG